MDLDRRAFLTAGAAGAASLWLPQAGFAGGTPFALVTADLDDHVAAVDLDARRVRRRIPTTPGPRAVDLVQAGRTAVVCHTGEGRVSLIDVADLRVRRVLRGFSAPRYAAARTAADHGFVTDSGTGELVAIDLRRGRVTDRLDLGGPARHVTISPDGSRLWTALGNRADVIAVVDTHDPRRLRLVRRLHQRTPVHDVVFAADGRRVYVTSGVDRRIASHDAASGRRLHAVAAGSAPQHVAVGRAGALVANGDDGTVQWRHGGRVARTAEVPVGSYNIAAAGPYAVTPSLAAGTLAVLRPDARLLAVLEIGQAAHDAGITSR